MRCVNMREARQKFSDLVDAAEHGQSILITRHGKQVAKVGPAESAEQASLPDLSAFRASIKAAMRGKDEALSKAVIESRRQARY